MSINQYQRKEINLRSGEMCEAMVLVGAIYTRCWKSPVEVHHLLTRARGGHILDHVNEDYHLIHLCRQHHLDSDGGDAYLGNLLIDGYVTWDKRRGCAVYKGTDLYLLAKYGEVNVRV